MGSGVGGFVMVTKGKILGKVITTPLRPKSIGSQRVCLRGSLY